MAFRFLDPSPLIDRELELVAPASKWVEPMFLACSHASSASDPAASRTSRTGLTDFVKAAPRGHNRADRSIPWYSFWMRLREPNSLPIMMAGWISLRIADTPDLRMYLGHVGYNVLPAARGSHFAERAARLVLPIAKAHGLSRIWITCNPDNLASRRTCERLGCKFAGVVPVPPQHALYQRGDHEKCRYYIDL